MKAKIKKTGEIVDVIDYSHWTNRSDADYVSYIGSNGVEHDTERGLNFYWDFEPIEDNVENKSIDWEQRRYEIAKSVLQGIYANRPIFSCDFSFVSEFAVKQADALIEELKTTNIKK